ncbi:MAG: GNAT family N-acetyltransferase [Lachnospiraceae bacterium]|nr:GNAT family N-acetyltransferase [Lachnospiraceae bacterium]
MFIGNKNYIYSTNVRDNDILRNSFNILVRKTFCFDFTEWYNAGYWGEMYIPHVLSDGERVVSNVSVNIMQFDICGIKKNYIQLGTVMTDSEYCGKGLNRYIMENILEKYRDSTDGIYLFANDTVLDYYPKFGFVPSKEYEYFMPCSGMADVKPYVLERASISQERHSVGLYNAITGYCNDDGFTNQNDRMYMDKNPGLYQFWMAEGFWERIYYIPEKGAYVAADMEGKVLHIYQVFGKKYIETRRLAKSFGEGVEEVVTGYTPVCKEEFQIREHKEEDCTLFIMGEDLQRIEKDKIMFPVLSHA